MDMVTYLLLGILFVKSILFLMRKLGSTPSKKKTMRIQLAQTKAYQSFLQEDYALAVKFYELAQELGGKDAVLFQRKALAQIRLRDLEGAKISLETSIALDPSNPHAHNHLGFLLQEYGEWDSSIEEFEKALLLSPDFAVAWSNAGVSYFHKGDAKRALECYFQALDLEPQNALTLFNIAYTYEKLENWVEARLFFESYVKAAGPTDPQFARARAHLSILQEAEIPPPAIH